jgi:hypothetical protein
MVLKSVSKSKTIELSDGGKPLGLIKVEQNTTKKVTYQLPGSDKWMVASSYSEALEAVQRAYLDSHFVKAV